MCRPRAVAIAIAAQRAQRHRQQSVETIPLTGSVSIIAAALVAFSIA